MRRYMQHNLFKRQFSRIIMRAETKINERRAPICPLSAQQLVQRGIDVFVESSSLRIFSDEEYQQAGCRMVFPGYWRTMPNNTYVIGIKELPDNNEPLHHNHIYFAHAMKGQSGAEQILKRFHQGRGNLFDLEYLVDVNNRRYTSFSYWAGYSGAAITSLVHAAKQTGTSLPDGVKPFYPSIATLNADLSRHKVNNITPPKIIIVGIDGRSGRGADDFFKSIGWSAFAYNRADTANNNVNKILQSDIFLNCIFVNNTTPVLLTQNQLNVPHRLSLICDVSCDPFNALNPLPIYNSLTTYAKPTTQITANGQPIDIISIDNLPSFLPRESSIHFSNQLRPHLFDLLLRNDAMQVWQRALNAFKHTLNLYEFDNKQPSLTQSL